MPLLNDNISETLEGVGELIRELPPEARKRARYAAMAFEQLFQKLRTSHPRDPAVALGAAWAVFTLADRLVKIDNEGEQQGSGLIKLITL
jgi:hypothetical protein